MANDPADDVGPYVDHTADGMYRSIHQDIQVEVSIDGALVPDDEDEIESPLSC